LDSIGAAETLDSIVARVDARDISTAHCTLLISELGAVDELSELMDGRVTFLLVYSSGNARLRAVDWRSGRLLCRVLGMFAFSFAFGLGGLSRSGLGDRENENIDLLRSEALEGVVTGSLARGLPVFATVSAKAMGGASGVALVVGCGVGSGMLIDVDRLFGAFF
jgi:hypothetical protein